MEALSIPYDEIRALQISLRRDANFSFYNPESNSPPHLPDLPSAGESISELDPSPPELRCSHCNGRLLRGRDSIVCIFCGKEQVSNDAAPPRPIKFMATSASKWLLQSLDLDGSELSESIEEEQSNRRQKVVHKDIPLSELLDLEIRWPTDSEIGETRNEVLEKTAIEKLRTLDFEGLDLSSFSPEPKVEPASEFSKQDLSFFQDPKVESVEEQPDFFPEPRLESASAKSKDNFFAPVSQPFPSIEAQGTADVSLFESVQPAHTNSKDEDGGDDSFSGWEVEFQSADSAATRHQESKPFDPFEASSSVDLSAHLDSVFGAVNEVSLRSTNESTMATTTSASNMNDWFPDDVWSNSTIVKDVEITEKKTDNSFTPMDLDFLECNQLQTATNTMESGGDDYFDGWNNFTTSSDGIQSSSKQDDSLTVVPPFEKASEINLFGDIGKSENVDSGGLSGCFPQSDLFFETSNGEKGTMWVETASERADDGSGRNGDGGTEEAAAGGDVLSSENSSSKPELVEKYISQMHDLSFMLENDLSMPQKVDRLD
ncbi:hypothetical protein LINPERHAP2_LOCUS23818 [Linum perenne]